MISFKQVSKGTDLDAIASMATTIWQEHYTPIIGEQQVAYMLDKFQSVPAMREQIKQGYRYFLIKKKQQNVGYLSFEIRGADLFLSKIYLLKAWRGLGLGKQTMKFVEEQARLEHCRTVSLTVNKYNKNAIKAYESAHFVNKGALVQDIGQGFVMDDFLMELEVRL